MRLLLAVALISFHSLSGISQPKPRAGSDRVKIRNQRIVLVRTGRLAQQFPERRRAVIDLPILSGLQPAVLRRVRTILTLKNIFETSLDEYREDNWLDELTYQVNFNQNHLLDITFTQSGSAAYPDSHSKHFAVDLKKGTVLKANDVFAADKLGLLTEMVSSKLQEEVLELIREVKKDPHMDQNESDSVVDALQLQKFESENLNEFEIGSRGLTFLYDAGFPHVIQALQPNGRYFFSYAELKPFIRPDSALGQFVR
jgi:hypothetical protein